jgi:hypothetical protein
MANLSEKLRAYFLGELKVEEVIRLENEYLGDEAKFAELREAENDLLDDFVRNALPPNSRKSFEENYLNSPFRRQRLEFAQTFAEILRKESVAETEKTGFAWWDIFSFWKMGMAFASLLLLLIGGIWFFNNSPQLPNNEVAVSQTPETLPQLTPQVSPMIEKTPTKPTANTNQLNTTSPTPVPTPKPSVSPTPEKAKANQIIVLALSTVGMRDGGKTPQAILDKETKTIALRLNLAETNSTVLQIKISNAGGDTVYQVKNVRASGKTVSVNLPTNLLKTDDYVVELFTANSDGESEKISNYSFRVIKK